MTQQSSRPLLVIEGIPNHVAASDAAVLRSRLLRHVEILRDTADINDIGIWIGTTSSLSSEKPKSEKASPNGNTSRQTDEPSVEQRAERYVATEPMWDLNALIVPQSVKDELLLAIETIQLEPLVFDKWGLRAIEPFPRSALNFHGSPGTGKTLAAHGVASELGTKILVASYAQIESMYHGEGPKNVEAIFHAAQRDSAVLFIDEADSLLSRRLTNVTQGSEQAINSMRSQLLICLEKYRGVVIFATNLVSNYDSAFETRVRHVHFPLPDAIAREAIWRKHIPDTLPLADDVDFTALAHKEDEFCGRDIKNVVVNAALQSARQEDTCLCQASFLDAIRRIVDARKALRKPESNPVKDDSDENRIRQAVHASETNVDNSTSITAVSDCSVLQEN
jgi:SpoVK/Ycf46/Vps4 family AAA+-type ATPase